MSISPQKLGEKSFALSRLGSVSLLNVHRLANQDPGIGWDVFVSHLLLVLHHTVAPSSIRLQAAEVLDQLLIAAPKVVAQADASSQQRLQRQVLAALSDQAEPSMRQQTTTDIEIRRTALETLFAILESNGHAFTAGWERIFYILRTACATHIVPLAAHPDSHTQLDTISEDDGHGSETTRPLTTSYFPAVEKSPRTPVLVRTSFPSLQLICSDFLSALSPDELRDCIGTLADFGKQADDINVALTVSFRGSTLSGPRADPV